MLLDEIKNIKSSKKELRQFGVTVGLVFAALGGALYWFQKESAPLFLILGCGLLLCGWLFPAILKVPQKIWMTLAVILGWFMTRVILSALFYFVLTTIGVIARLLGKDFLETRLDKSKASYWNYRKKKPAASDCERQY